MGVPWQATNRKLSNAIYADDGASTAASVPDECTFMTKKFYTPRGTMEGKR